MNGWLIAGYGYTKAPGKNGISVKLKWLFL